MSFFEDVEAFHELTSMPENGLDSLTESAPLLTMAIPAKKQKKTNANGSAEHHANGSQPLHTCDHTVRACYAAGARSAA